MKNKIFLSLLLLATNIIAQHVEVNLFEKSSHIKYADDQVERFAKQNKLFVRIVIWNAQLI